MAKAYQPGEYESHIYDLWEASGAFKPLKDASAKPYSIIMPPPNANGDLHLGHAMYVVEDIVARYKRMQGHAVLWLPGTDHAGIETQFVFERNVLAPLGKSRFDLGPDEFYRQVMDYTLKNQSNIVSQLRSLGLSADWSKLKFTLDDDIIQIVYQTFKQLHQDGSIYRGNRIVNWCTRCHAAFADVEVKHVERSDELYTLDYGVLQIATTRPETIFADTAVAVNPNDQRYQHLIGQAATVPLVERPIPIIGDEHVDPSFGTGALKVTPGHDSNDYEIGLRHDLAQITVIDIDGSMINVPEDIAGKSVDEARSKSVELLEAAGKLVSRSPLTHAVGTHDRCGTVIEPLITEQWFMKVRPLVEPAIEAVKSGQTRLVPKRFEKVYLDWLENLHDWNISRQIWWGIRIPVYYKTSNDPSKDPYIISWDESEAKSYYGHGNYRAETDTFDTWFSSSQWPYLTLMTTGDLERFYPTDFMGTARDILSKWIVTMMMMSLYKTGKVPFKDVYLWGMVNDAEGKKMSKSRGNVINPLEVTGKYGTDALRLALVSGITPGNDGSLSEKKIEGMRNFNNKLWNVARFTLSKATNYSPTANPPQPESLADEWILHRISESCRKVSLALDAYRFSTATELVYSLLWDDLADWYLETSKANANPAVLAYALETVLRLAHPFAPFVTEAIWQALPWRNSNLITESWPSPDMHYPKSVKTFTQLQTLITGIRGAMSEIMPDSPALIISEKMADNLELLRQLSGIDNISIMGEGTGVKIPHATLDAWLAVTSQEASAYLAKLQSKRDEQQKYLLGLKSRLASSKFTSNAPKKVVEGVRSNAELAEALIKTLDEQIKNLK